MASIFTSGTAGAIPIWFVTAGNYPELRERLAPPARAYADAADFEPKAGQCLLLPAPEGLSAVLFGLEGADDPKNLFLPGRLPERLPDGVYRFANEPHDTRLAALAFALGTYRFTRYRKGEPHQVRLDLPQGVDREELDCIVEAVTLARDLINTPQTYPAPRACGFLSPAAPSPSGWSASR